MSAWIVSKAHIDYLITAGLRFAQRQRTTLRWFSRRPTDEELSLCYQEGEPWGSGVRAYLEETRRELTRETAGQVGAMLWLENQRSVNHRYAEDEIEEPYLFAEVEAVDPLITLKAINCYEYQSCEHPEWETSEARSFCLALTSFAVSALPGYEEAKGWGITKDDVSYLRGVSIMDLMRRED